MAATRKWGQLFRCQNFITMRGLLLRWLRPYIIKRLKKVCKNKHLQRQFVNRHLENLGLNPMGEPRFKNPPPPPPKNSQF